MNRGIGVAFVEIALNGQDWSDDNVPFYYFTPARVIKTEPKEFSINGGDDVTIYGVFNANYTAGKNIICSWASTTATSKETIGKVLK